MARISHTAIARVAVAAVASLLLGACGAGADNTAATPVAAGPAASSAAPVGTSVGVIENEFAIALDKPSLTAGTYTFTIQNQGKFPHNLTIEGPGLDKKTSPTLAAGASGSLSVALQKGTYELSCSVPGHKDKGMDMKITVG